MSRLVTLATLFGTLAIAQAASAQSLDLPAASASSSGFSWRSLVSEQLWSDVLVHGPWRIQLHALNGRHRLLDADDNERVSGSEAQCRAEFDRLRHSGVARPLDGAAVVTLHGYGRSRDHMRPLGEHLAASGKFTWINVNYASTRAGLDEHAQSLARVIAGLDGIDEIHFVCHSLGNLVVRHYLHEAAAREPRWKPDPRIRRMVMLGPPNQGAKAAALIADILHESPIARLITGPTAWQLARHWDEASARLATPSFEFGILAGGCGDSRGFNPLLAGDDDLVVRVAETRLAGAADFRLVPCRHGRMMRDSQIQQMTLQFLQTGYFTSPDDKEPIARPAEALSP